MAVKQQLIISGLGGQGVLFVTRLLAEAAIAKGLPVLTSETHGMAQRGGTVVSHLKVGGFASPLVRPLQADGLLALKAETVIAHRIFLKPGAWTVVNGHLQEPVNGVGECFEFDADRLALDLQNPKAVNLLVLGRALAATAVIAGENGGLFCSLEEILAVLTDKLAGRRAMLTAARQALETGYQQFRVT